MAQLQREMAEARLDVRLILEKVDDLELVMRTHVHVAGQSWNHQQSLDASWSTLPNPANG